MTPGQTTCSALVVAAIIAATAWASAQAPPTIDEILIEGHTRVDAVAIRKHVLTKTGSALDYDALSRDLRAIHAMGLFEDVRAELRRQDQRNLLVFIVLERPWLTHITFEGHDALDKDDLLEATGLKRFAPLDPAALNQARHALTRLYAAKGRPLTTIEPKAQPRPGDPHSVEVRFTIVEATALKVRTITFLGNKAIDDDTLASMMATRTAGPFEEIGRGSGYDRQVLAQDTANLLALYRDRGHLDARVDDPLLRLSRDKDDLFITIPIHEGPQYRAGEVSVSGDLLETAETLTAMLEMTSGAVFSAGTLRRDMRGLTRLYRDAGYAFVNVVPQTRITPGTHTVALTYDIQKGAPARFGRIKIEGHKWTRETVIRRELRMGEGDTYSAAAIERSRRRIESLRIFESVEIHTQPTSNAEVEVLVLVKERTLLMPDTLAFGFTPSGDLSGRIAERNLLGGGRAMALKGVYSDFRKEIAFRLSTPRLLSTDFQGAIEVSTSRHDLADLTRDENRARIALGRALEPGTLGLDGQLSALASFNLSQTDLSLGDQGLAGLAPELFEAGRIARVNLDLRYEGFEHPILPSPGLSLKAGVGAAAPFLLSERTLIEASADLRWRLALGDHLILGFRGDIAASIGLDGRPSPDRFFMGGAGSVRGFERAALGPTRPLPSALDPSEVLAEVLVGGNKKLLLSAALIFPIAPTERLRGVVSFDMGNAFDDGDSLSLTPDFFAEPGSAGVLRSSVSAGVWWLSPLGPVKVELGFPLQPLPGEESFVIQISGGGL